MNYTITAPATCITNDPAVTVEFETVCCGRTRTMFQAWVKRTGKKTEYQKEVDGIPHDEFGWYPSPTQAWKNR